MALWTGRRDFQAGLPLRKLKARGPTPQETGDLARRIVEMVTGRLGC